MTKPINGNYTFARAGAKLDRVISLLTNPLCRDELAEAMGMSERGVQYYLTALMNEPVRRIHIKGWRRNTGGAFSARYVAGPGKDAQKPPALTGAQKYRRYINNNPEAALNSAARKRLARHKPKRDAMTAALFGAA